MIRIGHPEVLIPGDHTQWETHHVDPTQEACGHEPPEGESRTQPWSSPD